MRSVFMQRGRLLDISIVIQEIERTRTVALGLEVAPLPLEFTQQIFLVTVVKFTRTVWTAGKKCRRQQFCLLIDIHHHVRLDAIEVTREIIGIRLRINRMCLHQSCLYQNRYEHGVWTLQGHPHHGDALRIREVFATDSHCP